MPNDLVSNKIRNYKNKNDTAIYYYLTYTIIS